MLAALVAWRLPALRFPAPRAGEVFALAFLAYALLVPDWAWRWEGHPGNEPKYLRQAVALGHGLTFDAEGVSAAMEDLPTRPLSESVAAAAGTLGRESWSMAVGPRSRRGRPRGDPGDAHHAADDPGQGGRRLLRARAGAVADARAGAAPRPGDQPRARPAGAGRGERPRVVRSRRSPRDGALPAGARRDGAAGARRGPRLRLRARAALPLLLLPVLPGDGGGAGDGRGLPDAGAAAGGPAAAPVALRRDAGDAAVAAPEVPAGLAGARGHGAVGRLAAVIPRSPPRHLSSEEPRPRGICHSEEPRLRRATRNPQSRRIPRDPARRRPSE